ncbi:MAG: NAD(P)-dependent oxidoreductase [Verrucomicrobia bacterium]|nr:NAD(P)-dependent oxidoreductase [Verrucomicrobiota bacterium]
MKEQRILILGGAGFLGSHVARTFMLSGWCVGIIDGLVAGTGGAVSNLGGRKKDLAFACWQPIERTVDLEKHLRWADVIVDAMAFTGHLEGYAQPLMDAEFNLLCHLRLIQALKSCPGKRVIYLASRSQYGLVPGEVVTEDSPCQALDPQGINKLAAEHFFRIYGKTHGFETVSLRLTNCYGPQQRLTGETGLVGSFIQDVLDDKVIEIFGNARRKKNLLYAGDAAGIIFDVTQREWKGFEVFNVGGTEASLADLLEMIFRYAGKGRFEVKSFPEAIKKIDVGEARFSDEKLRLFLGHSERTDLGQAVERTVDYFKRSQTKE